MELETIDKLETIVIYLGIIITLLIVIIELRKNLRQFEVVRENALHDLMHNFSSFWSQNTNAEIVLKGRKDYKRLNDIEKFIFQNFIDTRIRLFIFGYNLIRSEKSKSLSAQSARIKHFFNFPAVLACYEEMCADNMFPELWTDVIDACLRGSAPVEVYQLVTKGY